MPPPPFQHGYKHDIFLSYTHTDDQPDLKYGSERRCRWITEFMSDLRTRIEIVSGRAVDIWRDEEKLGAADQFNQSIEDAIKDSAILLVILSPAYFNSKPCESERHTFYQHIREEGRVLAGTKSRVVKVAKFRVELNSYPPDLRELLEYKFYVQVAGSDRYKEILQSEDVATRSSYASKVDDVAQEVAQLLKALEPTLQPSRIEVQSRGAIYVAETTSDLDFARDELRRHLNQLGYEVLPRAELRLLSVNDLRRSVVDALPKCRLTIHPVGGYYGVVPEGADGHSLVEIQLDLSRNDARNGDLGRIIWIPEGLTPQEEVQKKFLERLRTDYAGRGFELLEKPYPSLASRVEDHLKTLTNNGTHARNPSPGIYVVCDNADRAVAKTVRSFLYNQNYDVEWTPLSAGAGDLYTDPEHNKLLRRNVAHLVIHGLTKEPWIQDRIHELLEIRNLVPSAVFRQAIYLSDPCRPDKEEILARDIQMLDAYAPKTVADNLQPFLAALQRCGIVPSPSRGDNVDPPAAGGTN